MGAQKPFDEHKLFAGVLYGGENLLSKTLDVLQKIFGRIDMRSEPFKFDMTDYYEEEMGKNLQRIFVSFDRLVDPQSLSDIKIETNKIEMGENGRLVNIDPGILCSAKVMLATTKDYSHRLPLNNGIYGEVTLWFKKNSFEPCPWTYPDYKRKESINFFNEVRRKFKNEQYCQKKD